MTNKDKPTIVISLTEMINIHRLIWDKIDSLCSADDPLRVVLKDLGPPPGDITEADNREIQLTLQSRFKKEMKEEEENIQRYAETKEMCLPILRAIPMASTLYDMTLVELLESGAEWARKEKQKPLEEQISTVLKNLVMLEKAGLVTAKDDYASFVHDLALEVTNRAAIRERQKKEITRLKMTLEKLRKNTQFLSEQIADYEKYLEDALKKQYEGKKESKLRKPVKFNYEKLEKMGVIVDTDLPDKAADKTKFEVSVPETGIFEVVAIFSKESQEKTTIRLDELLEKHYRQDESLELPHMTWSVDMTLYLFNKEVLT
jgi:Ras GTPase-activating-like protein IQGAP2/3